MAEILRKLCKLDLKMCEAPLMLHYDHQKGAGKMRMAQTVLTTLRLMARGRFNA